MEQKDNSFLNQIDFYMIYSLKIGGKQMKRIASVMIALFAVLLISACAKQRDEAPKINGVNLSPIVEKGGTYDPLEGVTVSDREDKDIKVSDIVVSGFDADDLNYPGTYTIILTLTDSAGNEDQKTISLTVKDSSSTATAPTLVGVKTNQTYYIGSGDFNPIAGVTATDEIDGNLTSQIEITGVYLLAVAGTYNITVRVTNSAGLRASETIVLRVLSSEIPITLTSQPITITLWHAMGEANQALLQKYADSFKKIYPNVTVVIPAGAGNYDTLKNNMINAITANAMPNLVQAYPDHVSEYLNGNAVLKLNPYIESDIHGLNGADAIDDIIASYLEENSQYDAAGTYYSLPFNKSTEVMIYNKTVFDKLGLTVPTTWQDVIAMAPALKAEGDAIAEAQVRKANPANDPTLATKIADAKKLVIPAAYDSTGNAFITFTRQWAGAYTSIDFSTFKGNYLWHTDANTKAAMEFLKANKGIITLPEFWDQQYASTPFVNQQTFITIGSSAGVRYNVPPIDTTTNQPVFEIGVAAIPYNADKEANKAVIQQGTNVSLLKTGTNQEQLASWLFLKHIINTENTVDWAMNTGYLPVRTSGYESATYQEFLNNPTANQLYISMGANAAYTQKDHMYFDPAFIGSSRARNQVGLALERIMLGDGNIDTALYYAYTEANLGG